MTNSYTNPAKMIGERLLNASESAGHALLLFWQTVYWLKASWVKRGEIVDKMAICGLGSLPVVVFVALFTGMTLALQAGNQLARFNQEANIGALVTVTMLREMGPVMTCVILSALVGSAYAAELGTMTVSEEIDALRVMSISPVKFLVMPRVLALAVMAPILTLIADCVGIVGGALIGRGILGIDFPQYFETVKWILSLNDAVAGMSKAVVFGIILGTVGCSYGLRAEHGAAGVGAATMKSVVVSFMLILLFNYFLTWLFYPAI